MSDWRLALWLAEASLNCHQSCFPHETIKRSLEFLTTMSMVVFSSAEAVPGMRPVFGPFSPGKHPSLSGVQFIWVSLCPLLTRFTV